MVQHTLNDRACLLALSLTIMLVARPALAANPRAAKGHEKPNILIIISDDQTWNSLSSAGNPNVKTPHIDRLAKRGTTFTHAFNMGGFHGAVCVASRGMLMTGRTLWNAGGNNCGDYTLWPQVLGQAGYDTYVTGKWHNGPDTVKRGFTTPGPLGPGMLHSTDQKGEAYNRPAPGNTWDPADPKWKGQWMNKDGQVIHSSEYWANNAIGYLNEHASKSDDPFYMYVSFHASHDPRQAPQQYQDMYPPKDMAVPDNFLPEHPFDQGALRLRDEVLAPFPRTREIVQVHLSEYYAMITHMDDQIGRILDALEKSGKADNTIIVFTADHGLAVGQHGLFGKQNLYDHSVRVPFIIAGPGIPQGASNDAMIYMQNLFATTCEMAQVEPADTVQYTSILPLITGEKKTIHDAVYLAYTKTQRAIRTNEYKYIEYPKIGEVQLFDLKNDPLETTDLAEDPQYATKVKVFAAQLRQLMAEHEDPLLKESQ